MKNSYFLSQPHQPFFILAFVNALLSMLIFMFMVKGIVSPEITASNFHAYAIIYLVFTPAFLGFLFTTFPRFSSTEPITQKRYLKIFYFFLGSSFLFLLGSLLSSFFTTLAIIILFIAHFGAINILLNVYFDSPHEEKHDQYWILVAFAFGLLAHFLFLLSIWIPSLHTLSIQIAIYLYLFLVAFSVAQRMIPFFSHCMIEKNLELLPKVLVTLLAHVILENSMSHSSFIADLVLAYLIGKELRRWNLPFPNPNPLLWILHIALFWIPVAFILSALTNFIALTTGSYFLFLDIHALMLGFLFTVMIGFGTRVTLGHSGNAMQADKLTTLLFYGTQVVVVMRLLTSLAVVSGWDVLVLFDISITLWLIFFIVWASRFFLTLIFKKNIEEKEDHTK